MKQHTPPKSILSFKQRMEVYNFVKEVGHVDPDGYWKYNDAYSDKSIAAHFGFTEQNVASVRKGHLGNLNPQTGSPFIKKVYDLEARVQRLEELLDAYTFPKEVHK